MTHLYQNDLHYRACIWAVYLAALEQSILKVSPDASWALKQQIKHIK